MKDLEVDPSLPLDQSSMRMGIKLMCTLIILRLWSLIEIKLGRSLAFESVIQNRTFRQCQKRLSDLLNQSLEKKLKVSLIIKIIGDCFILIMIKYLISSSQIDLNQSKTKQRGLFMSFNPKVWSNWFSQSHVLLNYFNLNTNQLRNLLWKRLFRRTNLTDHLTQKQNKRSLKSSIHPNDLKLMFTKQGLL